MQRKMSHRFLQKTGYHIRRSFICPIVYGRSTKYITSYLHAHNMAYSSSPTTMLKQEIDLNVSDLFSSSDDDSDLSDNESDNTSHNQNMSQKQNSITPKYQSHRVIISNLNDSVNTSDLNELGSKYGSIADVYLPMNRNDNAKHRGFGYVTFTSKEQSQKAITNINGTILYGNVLRAGYAKPEQHKTQRQHKQNKARIVNHTKNDVLSELEDEIADINIQSKTCKKLLETTINISGLPNTIKMHQITKMFNGIGKCRNVYLYEYEQFDAKFINAVVKLDLQTLSFNDSSPCVVDVLQPMSTDSHIKHVQQQLPHAQTKRRLKHKTHLTQTDSVQGTVESINLDDILQLSS
eukprot:34398_1